MKKILSCVLLFIIFFQTTPVFSQKNTGKKVGKQSETTGGTTEKNAIEPNWQLVVGGAPVGNPLITEYGFAVPLEGRTMAAVSESGNLMWFAGLPGARIAPHSSTIDWEIPWTEEPGGRQSVGSQRVGHD